MRTMPQWAQELTLQALIDNRCDEIPTIRWTSRSDAGYRGTTYYNRRIGIWLRVGRKCERWEQKLVLLHELAHWMLPRGMKHSDRYWAFAFKLFRDYGLPIRKVLQQERRYRKGAVNGYKIAKKGGE